MKLLILTSIAVMCFAGLATADAYDDRKQRQREDERAYAKRRQQRRDDKRAYERRQQQKQDDKRANENANNKERTSEPMESANMRRPSRHAEKEPKGKGSCA